MVEGFPESIKELNKQIRDLGVADEDVERYLLFEEHPDHFVVKYRSWMAPSLGSLKIKDYLVNQLGATYEAYPKAKFIIKKRQRAEVPEISNKQVGKELSSISQEPQPAQTLTVKLSQLQHGVFSPRKIDRKWIEHLKEAIASEGVEAFPLPKVRPHPDILRMAEPRYQIVDGEHFCTALEELNFETVKVQVASLSDEEADYEAMRLNQIHGKPLEPIEEARHIKKMMEKYGFSQEQIGKKFHRSQDWVSARLALLEIPEKYVTTRVVTSTHAREIVKAPEEARGEIVEKVEREGLSTRQVQAVVGAIKEAPETKEQILTKIGVPVKYQCGFPDCQLGTYNPTWYGDVPVCPSCDEKIQKDPSLLEKLKKQPKPPPKKIEKKEWKPPETKEYREALKHPKVSKMEELVALALTEKGVPFEQQAEFCLEPTKVDFHFPQADLVVELRGEEIEKRKGERDEVKREKLSKLYGKRVLVLTYDAVTKEQQDEILQKIMESLKS